jgi:hypothetical protein
MNEPDPERVKEDRGAPFGALKKEVKQEVIYLYHCFS